MTLAQHYLVVKLLMKSVVLMRNSLAGTADVRLLRVLGGLWKLVRGILNAAYTLIWTCLGAMLWRWLVRLDEVSRRFTYFFVGCFWMMSVCESG